MVPLALGVRGLIKAIRAKDSDDQPPSAVACGLFSVASVTVANGADNISVYTPTFRTIGVSATLITVAVFAVLVALWCLIGTLLGSHKKITEFVERYTFSELRMRTAHSSASADRAPAMLG
ncbi:cadmium resistance transporter [Microbispora sp. H10836]|uniref:cadmium resistance transporter n=1 Tax=Microbispora sp. H10836 TaxID=2729106 RepID=UPI0020161EF4|nr:cadmium resistance transporter [Microbispora sp. H10836]